MFTSHSIWLIVVSIILLLAMTGCIIMVIGVNNTSYTNKSSSAPLNCGRT
jgi:hypothetical protein